MRHAKDSGRLQLAPARRQKIVELVADSKFLTTAQICARTGASAATVRRDLQLLDRLGRLVRVHGGASTRGALEVPAPADEVVRHLQHALATLRGGDLPAAERSLRSAIDSCRRLLS
jgi:hypothetical protein